MTVPILAPPVIDWYCPNCGAEDQTREPRVHIRYHTCPKLRYLSAPMVRKGVAAKVEIHEIEGYVGKELVQYDPEVGRPIMNIETTRDEGTDLMVFAPTATASIHDLLEE
jgi:hypothetical protein